MQKVFRALLVTTLMAGIFCQIIVSDNSTLSPCTTGARSAVDSYIITGTIGDNMTTALNNNWGRIVFINVLRRTSLQPKSICQLFLDIGMCQPAPVSTTKCVCFYNTTTDQAHFTVSDTVQANDSNAVIFVQWNHQNKTVTYSSKNYTFPEIYDVNAAQLNLTVSGVTGNLPPRSCSFSLTLNKTNDLELCCSNTAKPCYPQISFNGTVVTNNTETCVTYLASQLSSDGVTGVMVLSYSVCNLTDYRQGSSCIITPKPTTDAADTTTVSLGSSSKATDGSNTTTVSPSPSSHATVRPAPPTKNSCTVICPAVIVPVVLVIIIGAGIAVYCYKIKKRSKAVSNHGKKENADKTRTSEHPERDRHIEHTNQAYDGRRSSPSEVTIDGVKTTTHDNLQQHSTVQKKDINKQINDRTNDGNASHTVPGNPRQLPPLKGTHTHGQLRPMTESRPTSVEITSTTTVKL